MSNPLNRAELPPFGEPSSPPRKARNYHLYMAKDFSALAAAARTEDPMNSDCI